MRLPELTKPQWDAALDAARALMNGDPLKHLEPKRDAA
jgi:hypothetical protein